MHNLTEVRIEYKPKNTKKMEYDETHELMDTQDGTTHAEINIKNEVTHANMGIRNEVTHAHMQHALEHEVTQDNMDVEDEVTEDEVTHTYITLNNFYCQCKSI